MSANPPGVEFIKTISKFSKRKKKFSSSLVYVFQKTWNEAFSCLRRAVTKKRDARAELLFCVLFAFLPSRFCRRRRCLKPCANERNISLRVSFPGALAAGRKKERELATTSLKFENLHRKSRGEMLIGGDDISFDVITLGSCFSMFVYIRARFLFSLIGGNLTAQSTGGNRGIGGIGGGIQIPET